MLCLPNHLTPLFSGKSRKHTLYEYRYDGSRYSERWHQWGNVGSSKKFISKEQGPYNSLLWDGRRFFVYIATIDTPGRLLIYNQIDSLPKNMKPSHMAATRWGPGMILSRGVYDHKRNERVDFTLRRIRGVSLKKRKETIRGIDCYVIEAGRYKLWIDPEHGYNIAQARFERNNKKFLLHDVRFREINDVWIIEEAIITKIESFKNGDYIKTISRCTLTDITLNPDHNSLGSFLPDNIRNGATVLIYVGPRRVRGASGRLIRNRAGQYLDQKGKIISCTWQDGKVVDE